MPKRNPKMAELVKPYTFTETQATINGRVHGKNIIEEGLTIRNRLGIMLIDSGDPLVIKFFPLECGLPEGTGFEEPMELYKGYHYQQVGGIDLLIRSFSHTHKRTRQLHFDLQSRFDVVRVRDISPRRY